MALAGSGFAFPAFSSRKKPMGLASATYAIRLNAKIESTRYPPFQQSMDMLEHCKKLGAGGIQTSVGRWEEGYSAKIRDRREELELFLEAQTRLPQDSTDIPRFEADIIRAGEAGATIVRSVCLSGRRYENFDTLEAFQEFRQQSLKSLRLAAPVMEKHRMKLAVENHKDWRIDEMLTIMKEFESEWMGITLDTGNNLALMEDPIEVVEAFAPYTKTIHFKDMACEEYEDGFLLSEVPLGEGMIDLNRIIAICDQHCPDANFNLEMITRDPLKIPYLNRSYWNTLGDVSGREVAGVLQRVKSVNSPGSLPHVTGKTPEEKLAYEEENNRLSFEYARNALGLG